MVPPDKQSIPNRFRFLVEATLWHYRGHGFILRQAVRNRLLRDPFFSDMLAVNRIIPGGVIVDLGCGHGILLALWSRARALGVVVGGRRGGQEARLIGYEINPVVAESARLALAGEAEIMTGDVRSATLPRCHSVILQDALLFLELEEQATLLERIALALEIGGCLILREPDTSAWGYRIVKRLPGNAFGLLYGERGKELHPRSREDWINLIHACGLQVEYSPKDTGRWFTKTSLVARKNEDFFTQHHNFQNTLENHLKPDIHLPP